MKSVLFKILILVVGVGILYMSLTRAGLEKLIKDERIDNLRKVPVSFDGRTYRLPETNTLPTNNWYFLKQIRDELWIKLTNKPGDKAMVTLLIADKKMEEAKILNDKNENPKLISKTVDDAVNKLLIADQIVRDSNMDMFEKREIEKKTDQAFWVYRQMINSFKINDEEKRIFFDKLAINK